MTPVIVHADGTDCDHVGDARAGIHDDDGPACAAGQRITHVRFGETTLDIYGVYKSLADMADAWTKAITPIVSALAEFGRTVSDSFAIRALAAASEVVDEARRAEEGT